VNHRIGAVLRAELKYFAGFFDGIVNLETFGQVRASGFSP